jgi:hypothetical protein
MKLNVRLDPLQQFLAVTVLGKQRVVTIRDRYAASHFERMKKKQMINNVSPSYLFIVARLSIGIIIRLVKYV